MLPWIVLPSQVLSLVGSLAGDPAGSAHSRMLTCEYGVKYPLASTEIDTDSPSLSCPPGDIFRVGDAVLAPAVCPIVRATTTVSPHAQHASPTELPEEKSPSSTIDAFGTPEW